MDVTGYIAPSPDSEPAAADDLERILIPADEFDYSRAERKPHPPSAKYPLNPTPRAVNTGPRPADPIPLIGNTPFAGRVVSAEQINVAANGSQRIGTDGPAPSAMSVHLQAAATGLSIVSTKDRGLAGYPIPFGAGIAGLKLDVPGCYVFNSTGADILLSVLITANDRVGL